MTTNRDSARIASSIRHSPGRAAIGLSLAMVGIVACSGQSSVNDIERTSAPIINGMLDPGDPAVVRITFGSICTGVLVSPHVILTAAHCVSGRSGPWKACFGEMCASGGMTVTTTMGIADPAYRHGETHDQAVLILPTAPPGVPPVPLNRTTLTPAMAGRARIVGFGEEMPSVHDNGNKYQAVDSWDSVDSNWVHFPANSQTVCNGDSGGPALQTIGGCEVIIGIVSHDSGGCLGEQFYNRVDNQLSFVDQYIQMADPGFVASCGGSGSDAGSPVVDAQADRPGDAAASGGRDGGGREGGRAGGGGTGGAGVGTGGAGGGSVGGGGGASGGGTTATDAGEMGGGAGANGATDGGSNGTSRTGSTSDSGVGKGGAGESQHGQSSDGCSLAQSDRPSSGLSCLLAVAGAFALRRRNRRSESRRARASLPGRV